MDPGNDLTTAPESEQHDANAAERARAPVRGLVVLYAPGDPEHLGSFLPVTNRDVPMVLGRGAEDGASSRRATFFRQRPGENTPLVPLRSQAVSRAQLELRAVDGGIAVTNVGRLPLLVDGEPLERATVAAGAVLEVGRQLVLLVTERPGRLEGVAPSPGHAFGAPDAFGFVGESPAAWRLRGELSFIGPQRGHVLLLGASGTGKDLVARAIHGLSGRKGPLVARNAATLPETLLDAELFGNPKGYPSPGMPDRKGLVGAAHGGTLFLDEIGDLPSSAQPHLLRLLDHGEYQRLGESERRTSDFRLIAATNLPETSLRPDLLARFDIRLRTPPLVERREDIVFLALHLLAPILASGKETARFRNDDGLPPLSTLLVRRLAQHSYTANVRELRQLLVESAWRSAGDTLEWCGPEAKTHDETSAPAAPPKRDLDPDARAVQAAIDDCNGSLEKAWRQLGLSSRHALARLVQKHGLVVTRRR
jgi:transcriptional regulator with AAA-type ATPase domain